MMASEERRLHSIRDHKIIGYGLVFMAVIGILKSFFPSLEDGGNSTQLTASKKVREFLFPFAVLFHFLIIIYHGIFSFFFSIVGDLIICLIPVNSSLNLKSWFQKKLNIYTQ